MNLTDDNETLCRQLLRIIPQIRTNQVQVKDSNISRVTTGEGVIYGFTIHLEPPERPFQLPHILHGPISKERIDAAIPKREGTIGDINGS